MRIDSAASPHPTTTPSPAPSAPGRGAPAWDGLSPVGFLEGLSPAARRRVHDANVRTLWRDVDRYEAYLERYLEGARRCRTVEELRAYGPPALAGEGLEPDGTKAERMETAEGPSHALRVRLQHAYRDLADVVLRLERRPVPLDVFFDLSLTARVESKGRSYGGTVSARGGAALDGGAGAVSGSVASGRREVGVEAGPVGAKATFVDGKLAGAEVSVRPVPGVAVHSKRTLGGIEHGLSVGKTFGGAGGAPAVKVEARATVGVNLLGAGVVLDALGRDFWREK